VIQIQVGRQQLIDLIQQADAKWIADARVRTSQYVAAQDYTGGTEFWGRIKTVYIRLQFEKCAYCETKLQGSVLASKVHEVEHFRPKSSLKAWPDRKRPYWRDFPASIVTGAEHQQGYFALAYHPFNYAIACTRCNSTLKSNYFPIRGTRMVALEDPSQGASEESLLVYPVSDIDHDPSDLIEFDGVLAVPKHRTGPLHEKALTTIWFFQLNHQDLTLRRAELLVPLWNTLEIRRLGGQSEDARMADEDLRHACLAAGQFSACVAAFCDLYDSDRARAKEMWKLARSFARSVLKQAAHHTP
jgi:hypothetical protein